MATVAGLNKRTSPCSGHQFRVWRRRSIPIPVLGYLWHNQHHTRRQVKAERKEKVLACPVTVVVRPSAQHKVESVKQAGECMVRGSARRVEHFVLDRGK